MSGLLAGKRIVVTGAARGLGRSFAAAVAQAGASVVMCDILAEELQDSAASLREQGAQVEAQVIDLGFTALHHCGVQCDCQGRRDRRAGEQRCDGNRCRWQNHDGIRH